MYAADSTGEEFGYGEYGQIGEVLLLGKGDGVGDDDFFDGGNFEAFDGRTGEDAMGGAAIDVAGTMFVDDPDGLG